MKRVQEDELHKKAEITRINLNFHRQILALSYVHTNIEKIKTLLIEDIDINYREESNGYTALMLAVAKEKYPLAQHILNLGGDPSICCNQNKKASDLVNSETSIFKTLKGYELLYATFDGDLVKMRQLINQGTDVNFQGLGGYYPLLISVEQNFTEITEFLLLEGADITLTRDDGQGVFELVTNKDIFNLLIKANKAFHDDVVEDFSNTILPNTQSESYSFFSSMNNILSSISSVFISTTNKK